MSGEAWPEPPEELSIREFSVNGIVYVSTLLDATLYSRKSLAELYLQRWKIEVDFRSIKTQLGMDMLRCKSAEMVKKEISAAY